MTNNYFITFQKSCRDFKFSRNFLDKISQSEFFLFFAAIRLSRSLGKRENKLESLKVAELISLVADSFKDSYRFKLFFFNLSFFKVPFWHNNKGLEKEKYFYQEIFVFSGKISKKNK